MTQAQTDAASLSATIVELRSETEANRRIAQPIVEGLINARLNRVAIVEEHEGLELSTVEALDVYETLAGQEASVGWVTWNNSLPCLFSRYLDPVTRQDIFQDPQWFYAIHPSERQSHAGRRRVPGFRPLVTGFGL